MELEKLLNNFEGIVNTAVKIGTSLEDYYDNYMKRRQERNDEYLGNLTNEQLRFYKEDCKRHPQRYKLVSKADIKAARQRIKQKRQG